MLNEVGQSLYSKKKDTARIVLNVIIVLLALFLVFEINFNVKYTGIYVVDCSMNPTLSGGVPHRDGHGNLISVDAGGDYVYIRKIRKGEKPKRGDIIVLNRVASNDKIIKRAIAFEDQTVKIVKGQLYVDNELIKEDYLVFNDGEKECNTYPADGSVHVVSKGGIFLLGDNRNESSDSRQNGDYPAKDVLGVVPQWSLDTKSVSTAFYTFFNYTIKGK